MEYTYHTDSYEKIWMRPIDTPRQISLSYKDFVDCTSHLQHMHSKTLLLEGCGFILLVPRLLYLIARQVIDFSRTLLWPTSRSSNLLKTHQLQQIRLPTTSITLFHPPCVQSSQSMMIFPLHPARHLEYAFAITILRENLRFMISQMHS